MHKSKWGRKACGIALLWVAAGVALPAQTFTTLYSFNGADGFTPTGALVQGSDGRFYGTTDYGGANTDSLCIIDFNEGCGTVYKITSTGKLTTVYSFCSQSNCTDGIDPYVGLIQATNGSFYGTTFEGGTLQGGTVFKISPQGVLTTLYSFCSMRNGNICTDGAGPLAKLVQGSDGNFYGTTYAGGASSNYNCASVGCGTIFKISPSGKFTTLLSFNSIDGASPAGGLIQATDGNFYGTTEYGGPTGRCASGCGTIFKLTPDGVLRTLHSFNIKNGAGPVSGLVQAANGDFYGTAVGGGTGSLGTAFKITSSGTFTVFYNFCSLSGCADGASPNAPLIQGTDGNLYGTTPLGGTGTCSVGCGTIFEITSIGSLKILHNFDGADGFAPAAGLIQGTDGKLYGTTTALGSGGGGTVFSLAVGLGPFLMTNPTSGMVGKVVHILGSNLTGATKVTFHGTAATFTVVSNSEITTAVPANATTGTVKVVAPGGTLMSNGPFQVLP
jgi:uncharacterized repeat protein (TIGR03803 family)